MSELKECAEKLILRYNLTGKKVISGTFISKQSIMLDSFCSDRDDNVGKVKASQDFADEDERTKGVEIGSEEDFTEKEPKKDVKVEKKTMFKLPDKKPKDVRSKPRGILKKFTILDKSAIQ